MNKLLEITNAEYQSIEAMSFSSLKEFFKSPAHYKAYKNKPREGSTPAQVIGTLVHMAILEPQKFESSIMVIDGNRNSKAVKEAVEQCEAAGKMAIKTEQYDAARFARDEVLAHQIIADLLSAEGISEASIVSIDPDTGAPIKCRCDRFIPNAKVILDLKTYSDLRDKSIDRQIKQQLYGIQALHYLNTSGAFMGETLRLFANVFIEIEPPYGVRLVGIDDDDLKQLSRDYEYKENLAKYKQCLDQNIWPNYSTEAYTAKIYF